MRDVIFGGANSLDNYLARPDHAVDWLLWGEDAAAVTAGIWKTIDTVLMGRKTYEVAARMGQANGYPGVRNTMSRQIDLELEGCRAFENGCVYVLYRVKHSGSA